MVLLILIQVTLNSIKKYNFYDFTIPALKLMAGRDNRFCIVTNQSGVGRGLISSSNLKIINKFIEKEFINRNNIILMDIYMCFDHPKNATSYRKPGLGMFLKAKNHSLKLSNCLMVEIH